MDEVALLKKLSLPTDTWFRRNLPFNQLAQRLNPKQRKMLEEVIESYGIRILATLTPRNTNILAYEDEQEKYEEIHLSLEKVTDFDIAGIQLIFASHKEALLRNKTFVITGTINPTLERELRRHGLSVETFKTGIAFKNPNIIVLKLLLMFKIIKSTSHAI